MHLTFQAKKIWWDGFCFFGKKTQSLLRKVTSLWVSKQRDTTSLTGLNFKLINSFVEPLFLTNCGLFFRARNIFCLLKLVTCSYLDGSIHKEKIIVTSRFEKKWSTHKNQHTASLLLSYCLSRTACNYTCVEFLDSWCFC